MSASGGSGGEPRGRGVRRVKISLRVKLTILAVAVSALPIGSVGYALIDINRDALQHTLEELQFAVLNDVAETVDRELDSVQLGLEAVARVLADSDTDTETRLALAKSLASASGAVSRVGIYDAGGALVDVIRERDTPDEALPDALPAAFTQDALRLGRAVGTLELTDDGARVLMTVPIRARAANWYAAGYVSLTGLQRRVEALAEERFRGYDDAVFIVDRELRVVAHSDVELVLAGRPMSDVGILRGVGGQTIDENIALFSEFRDARGVEMVGALRSLASQPWAVVTQLPRDQAYASLARMRTVVVAVVLAVIAIAVLAAVGLARRMTAPIRELTAFADELAKRRFDRRIHVDTRDELGVLGDAFSNAAGQLEDSERRLREELSIRADLGRYLPRQLVDSVVDRSQDVSLGGARREITVLFADVASFTPLAERHAPEEVVAMLNQLFTVLTEVVFRHGGTVDKFMGDCIMAFWGAPDPQDDHAARALAAAEDMLCWVEVANESWRRQYGATMQLAIGVSSGPAIVGNLGSESRMEYTAIGDVVNVGSRLEGLARPQQVLLTAATRQAAGDRYEYVSLGPQRVVGRMEEVELFELRL